MRPVSRSRTNKYKSAKSFRKGVGQTKSVNVQMRPMRGGWRL